MCTDKQRAANQANAQHSTGPSEEGKANSAGNNFKHGLCPTEGFFVLLPNEPIEEYVDLKTTLRNQYNPEIFVCSTSTSISTSDNNPYLSC